MLNSSYFLACLSGAIRLQVASGLYQHITALLRCMLSHVVVLLSVTIKSAKDDA